MTLNLEEVLNGEPALRLRLQQLVAYGLYKQRTSFLSEADIGRTCWLSARHYVTIALGIPHPTDEQIRSWAQEAWESLPKRDWERAENLIRNGQLSDNIQVIYG